MFHCVNTWAKILIACSVGGMPVRVYIIKVLYGADHLIFWTGRDWDAVDEKAGKKIICPRVIPQNNSATRPAGSRGWKKVKRKYLPPGLRKTKSDVSTDSKKYFNRQFLRCCANELRYWGMYLWTFSWSHPIRTPSNRSPVYIIWMWSYWSGDFAQECNYYILCGV